MIEFERAYEIDKNNANFENESYMNFCKDLVDYCNKFGARIYKDSISVNNIKVTKEDTKEQVDAKKYLCMLTVLEGKRIKDRIKICDRGNKKVTNEGGIIRKVKDKKGVE